MIPFGRIVTEFLKKIELVTGTGRAGELGDVEIVSAFVVQIKPPRRHIKSLGEDLGIFAAAAHTPAKCGIIRFSAPCIAHQFHDPFGL